VPLGVESDGLLGVALLGVELSLGDVVAGGVVAGGVDGMVVVGGDADGALSPGRSPTRSVFDSEQAVSRPALSVSAQTAVSSFFIAVASLLWGCGLRTVREGCNAHAASRRLDRVRHNHYQCV
jgi:hypothetical protein